MKKSLVRVTLAAIIVSFSVGMFSGCGKDTGKSNVQTGSKTKIVVHLAGSLKESKNDAVVKSEIEKRFQEASGINIDLDLRLHTNEDFNTKVNLATAASEQIDGIENNVSSNDGLNQFMTKPGFAMQLNDLLNKSGKTILSKIPDKAIKSVTIENKILAIPGVHYESEFGILIRKDWVTDAGLELPKTLDAFENVLRKFKERDKNVVPMVGFPWDVDRVILPGAYGLNPYFQHAIDDSGKLIPAYLQADYVKVLNKEYQWVKDGLWDKDNMTRPTTSMDNLFISGKSGVYIQWPEITHLIDISRKCKAANPDAEFAILAPLTGPNGDSGFAKQPIAFTGCVIPSMSKNAEILIKYFDWLYSDTKNYELAAYGVEGTDWVDKGDGLRGFPVGKEEEYMLQPSYSGAYKLLVNVGISDRVLSTYTGEERQWIQDVRNYKVISNPGDGIIFPTMDDNMKNNIDAQYRTFAGDLVQCAWTGLKDPNPIFHTYVNNYRKNCKDYLEFIDGYYKQNNK